VSATTTTGAARTDSVAPWRHTPLLNQPMPRTIRLWLRVARLLTAARVYPSMDRIPNVSEAKRKASKPPLWMTLPLPTKVDIVDRTAADLALPVATRTYSPQGPGASLPIVVFMHGGGFVNGGLDAMNFFCAHLALAANAIVLSVDYPLAPNSTFPAALDASYAALCCAAERGGELGGDARRLHVAGDSAGGNLAAAVCLVARDRGFPRIEKQVLIYPTLDAGQNSPRLEREPERRRRERFTYYSHYAGEHPATDELVSPLLAESVEGLPRAVILTAEHDALRDDGILYAQRLRDSGVPVRLTNYLGVPHGFLSMPRLCRTPASQAIIEIAGALSDA
jgi:acetyl esterase/lipase